MGPCARGALLAITLLLIGASACERRTEPPAAATGEWQQFEGSWNARGSRVTIPLGAKRKASTIELRGTMLLTGAGRPSVGFLAEVIALSDSETGLVGRAVWTDEQGDRVYSELKGEGTKDSNRIVGTVLGGTGRYTGVTGSYEFSWQFVMELEDGAIQGRAVGLRGRYRLGDASKGSAAQ